jgi:hypothetical protein
MAERRSAYEVLVWKPEVKGTQGRPWRRWKDIKIDIQGGD